MRSERILVVDDDPRVREGLEKLLRREGYEVLAVADGQTALERVQEEDPDLVLLDVVMPGLNGFEVCARIKAEPERRLTPVVLVTGLGDVEDRVAGIQAGADDFLTKPFERVELLARVRSLLRVKRFTDELERAESVVFTLAKAIEERDPYTQGHCERLSRYAVAVGRRMGLGEEEVEALRRGGIVHDVGKVAIPDAILKKEGPLSPEERRIMEEHTLRGVEICKPLRSFRLVLPIIRSHHEHLDGSGYPDGLRGEEIPLTARILSVVDVFDALTTRRPYKPPSSFAAALAAIEEEVRRGWWDPEVTAVLGALIREGAIP